MADMNIATKNIGRTKRQSTKVDLTAMVDLGFLLITFFMLATTMFEPKIIEVLKPEKNTTITQDVMASKTLTLMLAENNKVYWYHGLADEDNINFRLDSCGYDINGLRSVIMNRQKEVEVKHKDKSQMFVIIKPLKGSALQNIVDVFDEISICNVKRYAIADEYDDTDFKVATQLGIDLTK
jgi:biopolymer transport protein ExbD